MNKRITFWYVRPIGSHTNNSLARYLRENAKDLNDGEISVAGQVFLVYQVDYETISLLQKSRKDQGFEFKIYRRQGKNGQAQEVDLEGLKKRKKQKLIKHN